MKRGKRWYTIWTADTDELVCLGSAAECAAALGISRGSFYNLIGDQKRQKKMGLHKYEILCEQLTEKEWAVLDAENAGKHRRGRESSLKL